jgi:hypothetical protein
MIEYDKNEDYCTASPDVILGCTINYACFLHDRHYRNERKVRLSRKNADILLRDIIYRRLKTSNEAFELRLKIKKINIDTLFLSTDLKLFIGLRKMLAFPMSRLYYYTVRIFAKRAWLK